MYTYIFCPVCGNHLQKRPDDIRHRNYCPHCGFVHYVNPLPAVLAIVEKDRHFLLIKRGKPPAQGKWTFPSGFIEANESAEAACLRELQEETGIIGESIELLGVYYEKSDLYGDVLNIAYVVHPAPGCILKAGDDALEACFVPLQELGEIAFASFRQALQDYRKRFL